MQKKLLLVLMVLLSFALIVTGCGGSKNEAEKLNSWERVQKEGKLVVGLDDTYPPMGFRNDKGELVGFDIEMGAEISKRIDLPIEWQPTEWNTVIASLQAKHFDVIISGMNMFEERRKVVNFAGPYGTSAQVILVATANNDVINTLEDLQGKVVGTQLGSTGEKEVRAAGFDDKTMKLYDAFPQTFNDLDNGRIDAVVIDGFAAPEWIKTGKYKRVGDYVGEKETIGIAVRKEDPELMEKINEAIESMKEDGTLTELSMKWVGYDITEGL